MSLERDFESLGSTSVTVEAFAGNDINGAPSFSTGVTYTGIVENDSRMVMRPDGETEMARATIYVLSTSATVSLNDRVTIPGSTWIARLLGVDQVADENGQHHLEVTIA